MNKNGEKERKNGRKREGGERGGERRRERMKERKFQVNVQKMKILVTKFIQVNIKRRLSN